MSVPEQRSIRWPSAAEYSSNFASLLAAQQSPAELDPLEADLPIQDYVNRLDEQGVVVIRNALPPKTVEAVKLAHDAVLEEVQPIIDSLAAADTHDGSFYKGADMHRGLTVKMNATGRFELSSIDTRDGGELVQSSGLADRASEVMLPPLVREILEAAMVMPWRLSQSGTLPTYPQAEGGPWHRDIQMMFGDEALDLAVPDYYFNLLVPLEPVQLHNATEFLSGSHKTVQSAIADCPSVSSSMAVGDLVIFNGKIVHRGQPNVGGNMRSLVYAVFAAPWFEQGRTAQPQEWRSEKEYDD